MRVQLRRVSLFAHIISTLANTAQWLVPLQRGTEAQTLLTFCIGSLQGLGGEKKFNKAFFFPFLYLKSELISAPQSEIFPFFYALVPLLLTPERSLKPRKQMVEIR